MKTTVAPATQLLKSLMAGIQAEIGGRVYALSEDFDLVQRAVRTNTQTGEESVVWLRTDCTLGGFIGLANSMTEEERLSLSFSTVVSDMKGE